MLQSSELLKKSLVELRGLLREYQGELYLLKFKASTGQLDTTHKIKLVRRDIARVQTVINQKLQNKEKPPKVVKIKTAKNVGKAESGVESEPQTLESSVLAKEPVFEKSERAETQNSQAAQPLEEEKPEPAEPVSKEVSLLKPEEEEEEENKEIKEEGV